MFHEGSFLNDNLNLCRKKIKLTETQYLKITKIISNMLYENKRIYTVLCKVNIDLLD